MYGDLKEKIIFSTDICQYGFKTEQHAASFATFYFYNRLCSKEAGLRVKWGVQSQNLAGLNQKNNFLAFYQFCSHLFEVLSQLYRYLKKGLQVDVSINVSKNVKCTKVHIMFWLCTFLLWILSMKSKINIKLYVKNAINNSQEYNRSPCI